MNGDRKEALLELIDEQNKTKVLARLLREYRRTMESQKEKMKTQLIQANNDATKQIEKSRQWRNRSRGSKYSRSRSRSSSPESRYRIMMQDQQRSNLIFTEDQ